VGNRYICIIFISKILFPAFHNESMFEAREFSKILAGIEQNSVKLM
jgi:hypothetical protein